MGGALGWRRHRRFGTAEFLCDGWPRGDDLQRRSIATCHVTNTALVLGSTQSEEVVSAESLARSGVVVTRRPAGGGAVLVAPASQVWIDFWIPRGDVLWDDDIVRSAGWAGESWASALGSLGVGDLEVHRGRAVSSSWSRLVCFAGLGPGEVTSAGAKVVGVAQRRTREGARLLTVAELSWKPSSVVDLLCLDEEHSMLEHSDLALVARGLNDVVPGAAHEADASSIIEMVERAVEGSLP